MNFRATTQFTTKQWIFENRFYYRKYVYCTLVMTNYSLFGVITIPESN